MAMAMVPVGRAPVYIPASSPFKSSRAGLAMSSFVSHSALSSAQAFSGMSLGLFYKTSSQQCEKRGYRLIVRAGKTSMACTKRSRSRKSRARAQGFRARMATPGGRNVLRRRRRKGRKVLVPQSNPNSGKRA